MTAIKPGQRYIHEGMTIDIHSVENGQVYYRKWPKGVTEMGMWEGLGRCLIEVAEREIEKAGMKPEKEITP
jgi:hypothetical protein